MTVIEHSPEYDAAVSFLAADESVARAIAAGLAPTFKVFVYSEQQKELAGTDGVEKFRQVFRNSSRLDVVLFRNGWGATRWTRIEETAIKDKCLDEGWDRLFFVQLTKPCTLPKWVPETHLRYDLVTFSAAELIGAIKARLIEQGATPKVEDAVALAARLAEERNFGNERQLLLRRDGQARSKQEFARLIDEIRGVAGKVSLLVTSDEFSCGIHTQRSSVGLRLYPGSFEGTWDSGIEVVAWPRRTVSPDGSPITHPAYLNDDFEWKTGFGEPLARKSFLLDYTRELGWCWNAKRAGRSYVNSTLADELVQFALRHEPR